MKRNLLIGAGVVVVLLVTFFVVKGNKSTETADIITTVKSGPFKVEIETTGELEAKNSVKIMGPAGLRDFRIFQTTIQSIVDEGTVVAKGDWVATLDQSEFQTKLNEKKIELDRENAEYIQTQLDTTLELRGARDELINLKYAVEEKQIIYEQSKFEPPATIKQAEINVERAKREYSQALENYKIRKRKNAAKMREQAAELRKVQNEHDAMMEAIKGFRILAPEAGMVIYHKNPWDGKPLKAGSQINLWDPTVATLPDMTVMMSKTYVNEVDVRKVKPNQRVEVGLDAYPDKKLVGSVIRVANVGEQRPNSDAKVFEVSVEIEGTDPTIRPSMTTSNKIITSLVENALFVPLECLHSSHDTITFVYQREGLNIVKQEVMLGQTNANNAIILAGLEEGDRVYLSVPAGQEDKQIDLLPEMNGKRKKKEEEKPLEPEVRPATLGGGNRSAAPTR
ncbi:MAG TPA: HlyD family efflux transporter periplasmic adaptor subunit [Chryseosolibacter sp.]|nr:HlyD family efflux transporter periplasmic adaptor subunit [Chryseosolibacter sp.]